MWVALVNRRIESQCSTGRTALFTTEHKTKTIHQSKDNCFCCSFCCLKFSPIFRATKCKSSTLSRKICFFLFLGKMKLFRSLNCFIDFPSQATYRNGFKWFFKIITMNWTYFVLIILKTFTSLYFSNNTPKSKISCNYISLTTFFILFNFRNSYRSPLFYQRSHWHPVPHVSCFLPADH